MSRHNGRWWTVRGGGFTTAPGPQPLRSAEKDDEPFVPPAKRTIPFGFGLAAPEPEGCRPDCKPGGACRWVGCENFPLRGEHDDG